MRNTIDHRTVNILNKKMLRYFLEWLGMRGGTPDEYIWYGDTTHKRDIRVDGAVHITGPVSASNTVTISNEATSFKVWGGTGKNELVVQDDATIKHNLLVEKDVVVLNDATVKQSLVASRVYIEEDLYMGRGAIVGRDATLTNSLQVGKEATIMGDTRLRSQLIVGKDATVRERLYVGESIEVETGDIRVTQGSLLTRDATVTGHVHIQKMLTTLDLRVIEDFICVDATMKDSIYTDDERGSAGHPGRGVTCDITACGTIYHVVNGIITALKQKAWA